MISLKLTDRQFKILLDAVSDGIDYCTEQIQNWGGDIEHFQKQRDKYTALEEIFSHSKSSKSKAATAFVPGGSA